MQSESPTGKLALRRTVPLEGIGTEEARVVASSPA